MLSYAIGILKPFNNHILVVVCSFANLGLSQNGVSVNGFKYLSIGKTLKIPVIW